jgi:hypothetical protein
MTEHDFYPDGLTAKDITALQYEVATELRREGYPVPPHTRPGTHRPGGSPEPTETPASSASPFPSAHGGPDGNGPADRNQPDTAQGAGDLGQLLFTPAQAAAVLQVRESWLRRRAARRQVPCTFLGKHLRFSRPDLEQITADAARPAATAPPTVPGPVTSPRRPARPRGRGRTDSRRPDA